MTNETAQPTNVGSNDQLGAAADAVQSFPVVRLGRGLVEIGNASWEGLPALWFGTGGRGLGAPDMQHNRPAHDGETIALVSFSDIRGLEALERALQRVRADMVAATPNVKLNERP